MLETETTFTLLQDPVQSNVFKKLHNVALAFLQIHDRFTFVHVTVYLQMTRLPRFMRRPLVIFNDTSGEFCTLGHL